MELLKTMPGFRIKKSSVPSLKKISVSPSSEYDVSFQANGGYSRNGTHHEKSLSLSRFSASRANPRSILKRQYPCASREFMSKHSMVKFPNIVKPEENSNTISYAEDDSKSLSVEELEGVVDVVTKQKTERKVVTFHLGNREKKTRLAQQVDNQWSLEISSEIKPIPAKKRIIFLDSRTVQLRRRPNTEQLPKRSSESLPYHQTESNFAKINSRVVSSRPVTRSRANNIFQSMAEDYRKMWNYKKVYGESSTHQTYGWYGNISPAYKTAI